MNLGLATTHRDLGHESLAVLRERLRDAEDNDLPALALQLATPTMSRWFARFVQRLGRAGPDGFHTAAHAREYLDQRESWLNQLADQIDLRDKVRVPHLLECLYITPSTLCNLKCRFCAYPHSTIPRRIMSQALFADVLDQACAFGFDTFGLTPLLGEALVDPGFLDKLDMLEQHPGVRRYSFCTNFTVADDRFHDRIRHLTKLDWLSISLYGHDEASFATVTASPSRYFHDVLANLERLRDWPGLADHFELRIRSTATFDPQTCHPRLRALLDELAARHVRIRIPTERYSNWGGLIPADDLIELGIRLKPRPTKGRVPCSFLFYKPTVLPDGRVNACYADDGHATLIIGDLSRQRFDDIYSLRNDAYRNLLLGQWAGQWGPACRDCTGYRGIGESHYSYSFHRRPFLSLPEFLDLLE